MNDQRNFRGVMTLVSLLLIGCPAATPEKQFPAVPLLDALPEEVPDALRNAIAALELDALDPQRNGELAMQLHAHHLNGQAAILYARARHLDPDRFQWAYLHGLALTTLGDNEASTRALRDALSLRASHPGAQLALARLLQASSEADAAEQLYGRLVERNPAYAQAFHAYGKFLLEQGRLERAIEMLETALGLFNRYGQAHYTLALAHRELGQPQKASLHAALFERYRDYQPAPYDSLLARIAAMNEAGAGAVDRALAMAGRGRVSEAVDALEAIVAASPESLTPRLPLIDFYGQLGDYESASRHADAALTIDPESAALHDNIGVLQLREGRNDEAVGSFRRAVEIDPGSGGLHRNLAAALEAAGDLDGALSSYRTAVGLDPFDRQSNYLLARALLQADRPVEAVAVLAPVARFEHAETARYYLLIGSAHLAAGDPAAAASALQRAIALASRFGLADVRAEASAQLEFVRQSLL